MIFPGWEFLKNKGESEMLSKKLFIEPLYEELDRVEVEMWLV